MTSSHKKHQLIISGFIVALSFPIATSAQGVFTNPINNPQIYCYVASILESVVYTLLPAVAMLFVISGYLFASGRENATRLSYAKKFFFWTVVVTIIVLATFIIKSLAEGTVNEILGDGTIVQRDCKKGNPISKASNDEPTVARRSVSLHTGSAKISNENTVFAPFPNAVTPDQLVPGYDPDRDADPEPSGPCQISVYGILPETTPNYTDDFTVQGKVTSSAGCKKDIIITSNLSEDSFRAKPGETTGVSFTGVNMPPNTPPSLIKLDGEVGSRGVYVYNNATISATEGCGATNSVTVYSCSLANTYGVEQLCPIPDADKQKSLVSSDTADFSETDHFDTAPQVTVEDIIPESIQLSFDPTYVTETIRERKFIPKLPFTPFDDIKITMKVKTCGVSPNTLPFGIFIKTTNIDSTPIKIMPTLYEENGAVFNLVPGTFNTYSTTVRGWPAGIADDDEMEMVIDSISNERPVYFEISNDPFSVDTGVEIPIPFSNCVQVYGNGHMGIVTMRSESTIETSKDLLTRSASFTANQLNRINPFKTYRDKFSNFIDLRNYEIDPIAMQEFIGEQFDLQNHSLAAESFALVYKNLSSCKNAKQYFMGFDDQTSPAQLDKKSNLGDDASFTFKGSGMAYIDLVSIKSGSPTEIHEMGHSFCSLSDEYPRHISLYKDITVSPSTNGNDLTIKEVPRSKLEVNLIINTLKPNCVVNAPLSFLYKNILYGDTTYKPCVVNELFRPSSDGLMRGGIAEKNTDQFNVIGCGYCRKAIDGHIKDGPSYYAECMAMDGVVKPENSGDTGPVNQ